MTRLPEELIRAFEPFEAHINPLEEHDVSAAVRTALQKHRETGAELTDASTAEAMAFEFCEDYHDERTGWGTYYGPMMVVKNKEGQWVESPSIQRVTKDVLDYWFDRSQEAKHPVLRGRYADLVWDLSEKAVSRKPDHRAAQTAIDAYVEVANRRLFEHSVSAKQKLERGLSIAIAINDRARIDSIRDAVLALEEDTAESDKLGTWGYAFDLLVGNKKVDLDAETEQKLIKRLEESLDEATAITEGDEGVDPFQGEHAAIRLASYYRRKGMQADVCRVLKKYADGFLAMARKADAMLGAAWLSKVFDVLNQFGCKNQADQIAIVLRDLGAKGKERMVRHTETVEIPTEEVEKYISAMLEGTVADVLNRVATQFTPDADEIETQVKELAQSHPLMSIMPMTLVDDEGRETGKVGSVDEDLEGRVIQQMSQNMGFEAPFLRKVLGDLVDERHVDAKEIVNHILQSPLFDESRRGAIQIGVEAAIRGDHIIAAHVLVPQVEHGLRRLVVLSGRTPYKANRRHGGIQYKVLDDLLRDEAVTQVLTDRFVKYLKVVMTDTRGWNLRNDLCHGILDPSKLSWLSTDRVLHIMLVLALLREREEAGDGEREAEEDGDL